MLEQVEEYMRAEGAGGRYREFVNGAEQLGSNWRWTGGNLEDADPN